MKEDDEGNSGVTFVSSDWKKLSQMDAASTSTGSQGSGQTLKEDVNDPMLSAAVGGLFLIGFGVGFGLYGTGLNGIITYEQEDGDDEESESTSSKTAADYTSSVDKIIAVNDQFVLLGDIDTAEISEAVSGSALVKREGLDDYTVYGPEEVDSEEQSGSSFSSGTGSGIAVNSEAIIMFDAKNREALETLVATKAGESTRATEANSDLEWLINTAGSGDLVFGGYGSQLEDEDSSQSQTGSQSETDSEESSLDIESAIGFSSGLTFDGSSSTTGSMAVQFEKSIDQLDQSKIDKLRAETGSTASEQSVEIDGKRLTATATWSGNVFDNIYKESDSSSGG
jgi:hypothetical protein